MTAERLDAAAVRRLALARAGLLKPELTGFPRRGAGRGTRARAAAHAVIDRFGYLQLDSVSVAGARSHALVLLSRLPGVHPGLGEELLHPGAPVFEYWGHEASWIPLELYPHFEFRRRAFRRHPWWGNVIGDHRKLAGEVLARIRGEGPVRSADLEGSDGAGWWALRPARRVVAALWSSGELAVRERKNFLRVYDLAERVIPGDARERSLPARAAIRELLLRGLEGHGWATTGTLAATWRFHRKKMAGEMDRALAELHESGAIVRCDLVHDGRRTPGWIRPADLDLADALRRARPRADRGLLLSPFDPVLWDRGRVERLFGFRQRLEVFLPASRRVYGYYCLPVLAGERLVGRVDLKAERAHGRLRVLSRHFEASGKVPEADREAMGSALLRYAGALGLKVAAK